MRLVTKYDFDDLNHSNYPVDEAEKLFQKVKPLLIGHYIKSILAGDITGLSGIKENENYYDYERRLNKKEVKQGKPQWQHINHALFNSVMLVIGEQNIEFELWATYAYYINFNLKETLFAYDRFTEITEFYSKEIVGPGLGTPVIEDIVVNGSQEGYLDYPVLISVDFILSNGHILRIKRNTLDWTGIEIK